MFQSFDAAVTPNNGPSRLEELRAVLAAEGLVGFLVPHSDVHGGENLAARDARLAWLTGFTGSAGLCVVLPDIAGVFVDARYRIQVKDQISDAFTPIDWTKVGVGNWLVEHLPDGGEVGLDPWLHTLAIIDALEARLDGTGIKLRETDNLVDQIWRDRPPSPTERATLYPTHLAGRSSEEKRTACAAELKTAGHAATVLTRPDSICWLLNIRGRDVERIPIVQAFAILHADGSVELFSDPRKFKETATPLELAVADWGDFDDALARLDGPVRVDSSTAPLAVTRILTKAGVEIAYAQDPCILPKAKKTEAELNGTRGANLRDAVAVCEFLAWLDREAPSGRVSEIDVVRRLEGCRRDTNALQDISFDTICGSGPNGAVIHYRVTEASNRKLASGELVLVDSGGQYVDGTTDITRTVAIGAPSDEQKNCFTRVLQGMIAISAARWPKGLSGCSLDPLARIALWREGLDYDHGTGHGVGVFLSVHEGPQQISRASDVVLEPGMILSNEPGYYRPGAFGIRIENLVVVQHAPTFGGRDGREMLDFETLTWVPIDTRLVEPTLLSQQELAWLNSYHLNVKQKMAGRLSPDAQHWLDEVTAPI